MIKKTITEIFQTGIQKFSKLKNVSEDRVQIFIKDKTDSLSYQVSVDWQPQEEVTFLEIMDKKMDILGAERLSMPVIKNSLAIIANERNTNVSNISFFMYNYDGKIAIAVYDNAENIKNMTLAKYLQDLGLDM